MIYDFATTKKKKKTSFLFAQARLLTKRVQRRKEKNEVYLHYAFLFAPICIFAQKFTKSLLNCVENNLKHWKQKTHEHNCKAYGEMFMLGRTDPMVFNRSAKKWDAHTVGKSQKTKRTKFNESRFDWSIWSDHLRWAWNTHKETT